LKKYYILLMVRLTVAFFYILKVNIFNTKNKFKVNFSLFKKPQINRQKVRCRFIDKTSSFSEP